MGDGSGVLRVCGMGDGSGLIPGAPQGLCKSQRCRSRCVARSPCLETDATRMCALLVGLPDVNVIGVGDWPTGCGW